MKICLARALLIYQSLQLGVAAAETPDAATASATASAGGAAATESRWRLGAAFGYGLRSNPLLQSDDIPIVVDLDVAWFGERFFFDNGDLGLTFLDNAQATASVVARVNSDRVFFGNTDTKFVSVGLSGEMLAADTELTVPDRDYAVEMGVELLTDGRWGFLQASAYHDVSGTHEGYEIDVSYGFGWRNQRWYIEPSVGFAYKSEDLNDYYWGVRDSESNAALPAYVAGSGVNYRGRLLISYQLNRNWSFSLAADYERLNDDAAASPIVEEREVLGYFAGFGYRFR